MIQIQRHIEILLLSHDCVIIPGFGGFIAHHVDAHYDEDDRLWLPPYRTLGFNPQLTLNDSLLAQSYVEAYDISYPDALRQIEAEVDELKNILHSEGEYEMDSIGTLRVNIEGNIEFEPSEAGILSPEVYGLSDFSFKRLKDTTPLYEAPSKVAVESETATNQTNEEPTPALLEFTTDDDVVLATPIANSDLGNTSMSKLHGNIIYKLMPKDSNMTPARPVEKKVVAQKPEVKPDTKQEAKADVKPEAKPAEPQAELQQEDTYCIVLASQVKRSNAEEYVNQLKQRGIADARIYEHKNVVRVVCGNYANETEAYRELNKMSTEDEFAEAWVYKMKGV